MKTKQDLLAAALAGALTLTTTLLAQEVPASGDKTAASSTSNAAGSPDAPAEEPWHLSVVPLAWGPGISGNVTVRGHQATADVSLGDLLDHLKGIAMLDLELSKGKFGFYAQPNWVKLEADGNAGPLKSQVDMQLWIVDAACFYQLGKWGEEKPVTLDALAGVRYWNINNDLTLSRPQGITSFSGSSTLSLIDPIIGLRSQIYLTRKLSLRLHGDIGGFGVSEDSSNFSWQALAMLGYDFSRHFSLFAGYRALSVDKHSGSGSGDKGADLIMHGGILGFDFHW
jgi:opacity protein-like surface antigen